MNDRRVVASHVLWFYGPGGYEPGSFTYAIIKAFQKADATNWAKLAGVYPEYAQAIQLAKDEGEEALRQWGGIDG